MGPIGRPGPPGPPGPGYRVGFVSSLISDCELVVVKDLKADIKRFICFETVLKKKTHIYRNIILFIYSSRMTWKGPVEVPTTDLPASEDQKEFRQEIPLKSQ